ncbi:hypothetical protein glysoja_010022, partial [Glycine soja]
DSYLHHALTSPHSATNQQPVTTTAPSRLLHLREQSRRLLSLARALLLSLCCTTRRHDSSTRLAQQQSPSHSLLILCQTNGTQIVAKDPAMLLRKTKMKKLSLSNKSFPLVLQTSSVKAIYLACVHNEIEGPRQ